VTIVVLAHEADLGARSVFERVRRRQAAEYIVIESLATATVWRQQIRGELGAVELGLADGRVVHGADVTAVLNRVLAPPPAPICFGPDAEYAEHELTAFAASWIRRLGRRIVNEPSAQGLSGPWRMPLAWRMLAHEIGMLVEPLHLDSIGPPFEPDILPAPILVVAGEAIATVPAGVRAAIRDFTRRVGMPLLGVRIRRVAKRWRFLDATPYPDLLAGGEEGIAAVAALLRS